MKQDFEVLQERQQLEKKYQAAVSQLNAVKKEISHLQEECPHSIKIKVMNPKPTNVEDMYHYYCPICKNFEAKSPYYLRFAFNSSNIVDLSTVVTNINREFINFLENELLCNYEFYYIQNHSDDEIRNKILLSMRAHPDVARQFIKTDRK